MKLSQKLLALGGVTLADYACCPYDDYGMPHAACTVALPEKTPFSMESDWRNGACKAWESNVDATYDGNDNNCQTNENWGSCGFQRHFPWNEVDTEPLRNRGCVITTDATDSSRALSDTGCNCQGFGDAVTTAVTCKTENVIVGTTTSSGSCTPYDTVLDGTVDLPYFTDNSICCNPALPVGTEHTLTDGTTKIPVDCVQTCVANDAQALVDGGKLKCYETDFLGRRNIQKQTLYFKDSATYEETGHSSIGFAYDSDATGTTGSDNNSKLYNLAGVPFLGGICKLYVPVPRSRITSVQIAGVHVSLQSSSVFAAKVGSSPTYAATNDENSEQTGTAYCFSVVNPAEGMENSQGIHNGNVAGGAVDTTNTIFDPLVMTGTSLTRQAGLEPAINFFDGSDHTHIGTQLKDSAGFTANGDSKVGANFDVVVHIHSEWCNSKSFWNIADMQLTGDFNNGVEDYPLNLAPGTDQRTADAYATGQTGPLQLQQLKNEVTDTGVAEASALSVYTLGARASFDLTLCAAAIAGDATCSLDFEAYVAAYVAEQECNLVIGADCSSFATSTATLKAVVMSDTSNDGTDLIDTGCINDLADCTPTGLNFADVTTLFTHANTVAYYTAMAATTNAENARDAALQANNGFTHAHMDLMDKRNNMVATWNNVYEQDASNTGYLTFPHSDDDYFTDIDYTTDIEDQYLRWPNAGAFAAFYSFVTCANPPHISQTDVNIAADVNSFSIIYNDGGANTAPVTTNHYAHYGEQNLRARTLVMSQSDSDYRDEKCDERTFRGNLRQVGNEVTVCGPGQLPDTDNKRCSWNWNYYSSSSTDITVAPVNGHDWVAPSAQDPQDAEEWFDRNDPHSFDMWSTRKRRSVNNRKYAFNAGYWGVQQGDDGNDDATLWDGNLAFDADNAAHGAAIEIPIKDYKFNLVFKTANGDQASTPVIAQQNDNCFEVGQANCVCRPSHQLLGDFETETGVPFTFAADYGTTYVFDTNFEAGDEKVAHPSCTGSPVGSNSANVCTATETAKIRADLTREACDQYKPDGTDAFIFTDNTQSLVFDDPKIVAAYNPNANGEGDYEWEVSVQCTRTSMGSIASNVAQRDEFPDCFFGDEIWFTFSYSTSENNGNDALFQHNSYVSAWTSELKEGPSQIYIS